MSDVSYRVNSPSVVGEVLDNEAVIINLTSGAYYSLNESGSAIWTLLESGSSRDGILGILRAQFTVDEAMAGRHLDHFLAVLAEEALIVESDSPAGEGAVPEQAVQEYEPPQLMKYTDMQELILLDPIHDVDEKGWPHVKP